MTPSYNGGEHWLGFKPELVPGVAEATVTTFLVTESVSMNPNPKPIERKAQMATARRLPSRRGWIAPDGKTSCEIHASQPQPFYWALGKVVSTQPALATDPLVFLHTITDGGAPVSLTAEADQVYSKKKQSGVRVDKLTLKAQVGEMAALEIAWFGLTHTEGAELTSVPVFPTAPMTCVAMTVKIAGQQDLRIPEVEIVLDNAIEQLPVLEDAQGGPHVARRKEALKVTGKLKFIDFPAEQLAVIRNAGSFELVTDLLGDVISNEYREFVRITLPACQYTGGLDAESGSAIITGDANFEGFYDVVTGEQVVIEVQDTVSVITE